MKTKNSRIKDVAVWKEMGWDAKTVARAVSLAKAGHSTETIVAHIEDGHPVSGWID